jgi:hypothetical protein
VLFGLFNYFLFSGAGDFLGWLEIGIPTDRREEKAFELLAEAHQTLYASSINFGVIQSGDRRQKKPIKRRAEMFKVNNNNVFI